VDPNWLISLTGALLHPAAAIGSISAHSLDLDIDVSLKGGMGKIVGTPEFQ